MTTNATERTEAETMTALLTPETWGTLIRLILDAYIDANDRDGEDACRFLIDSGMKPWQWCGTLGYRFWDNIHGMPWRTRIKIGFHEWWKYRLMMDDIGFPDYLRFVYPDNLTYFVEAWRTGARPYEGSDNRES